MTDIGNSLFVVGIDIGSVYSKCAFSSCLDIKLDPQKSVARFNSWKCPTAILLDSYEEIVAFGYDAENKFAELLADDEHGNYYYFQYFRNDLHQQDTGNPLIKDFSGKPMEALKVFIQIIRYFKNDAMNRIRNPVKNILIDDGDFYFVLTVPAIWGEKERDFMRKAAIMADIKSNKVCIAIEPDAASLFILWSSFNVAKKIKKGEKYMVVDLGGSTKVTCHRICFDGVIEEIVYPCRGPLAGKSIEEAFYTFLCQICGQKIMELFKSNEYDDYIDLIRKFETKKHSVQSDVVITLPVSLTDLVKRKHKKFEVAIEQSPYKDCITYNKQKLYMLPGIYKGLFQPTISAVIKHIKTIQNHPNVEDINILVMVGRFSACELMQDEIHAYFGKSMNVVNLEDCEIAVVKGAVMLPFQPKEKCWLSKASYGVKCCSDWEPGIHHESKKVIINGKIKCRDIFCKLLSKGERIIAESEYSTIISVPNDDRLSLECLIFESTCENPKYTTDPDCKKILGVSISLPRYGTDVEMEVTIIFTDTLFLVRVRNLRTGRLDEGSTDILNILNTKEDDSDFSSFGKMNTPDFKELISKASYASYENRVYLAGACNVGKSSLASILIGEQIPKRWHSTDGLVIHFGRNGIHLEDRTMIPLVESNSNILQKLLLGKPNMEATKDPPKLDLSDSNYDNVQVEDTTEPTRIASSAQDKNMLTKQTVDKKTKDNTLDTDCHIKKRVRKSMKSKGGLIPKLKTPQLSPQTANAFQRNVLQEIRDGKYKIRVAPSDLIDFGGQRSFDMTHQLFIQHKGTFVLMFDGRYGLHSPLKEYPQGDITAKDIIVHWVNSILIYCGEGDDIMPVILFAATHSDIHCANKITAEKHKLIRELTKLFETHNKRKHIKYDRLFFINATNREDSEIELLKDALVNIAFQQPTWGQRMPVAWVPLELQIYEWRKQGLNLIAKEEIKKFNESNSEFMLSNVHLEGFLKFQHSLGKIMYIDQSGMQDFVVIQPTVMVNILRSFVTDQLFWPKDVDLRHILASMVNSGMVEKKQLLSLWSQPQLKQFFPSIEHTEYIIQLLVHLDILVEPKRNNKQGSKCDTYLVPCLVNTIMPVEVFKFEEQKTICLAYKLMESNIPTALSFKLIGTAVTTWPLKELNGRNCLYHHSAIIMVDENNELLIQIKGQAVVICLSNRLSKYLISPDVAASIQECLTLALKRVLIFYHECFGRSTAKLDLLSLFEIEVGEMCNRNLCLLPLSQARQKRPWTCIRGKKHETKYCLYWAFDRETRTCDTGCKGLAPEALSLTPNDQHLMRLAKQLDMQEFEQFFMNLGMKRADLEEVEHRFIQNDIMCRKLMALYRWKKKNFKVSLQDLLDGLKEIERSHYLCQIVREETSLFGISERRLQSSPSDEVLEQLSRQLGNCVIQLSIELGLSFNCIEETMYRYPKDMYGQIYDILKKWKQQIVKPSIYRLMTALQQVECGGVRFLLEQYK